MNTKKRKLHMGMVGGSLEAFIGEVHRKAARLDGKIDIVSGVFSSNPEKSKKTGEALNLDSKRIYKNFEEMAEKESKLPENERIDFVSIVTPNHLHFAPAKLFLESGFHVICDKPLAFNLKEGLDLKKIVKSSGKVFALTHNYTGYPMVKQARHMVRNNELGKVLKIIVEYPQGWLIKTIEKEGQKQALWRTDPKQSGISACMGDIGTHCENLASYITGLELESVCADLTIFMQGRKLDDDGNVLLRYKGGAKGVLHASQISFGEENGLNIRIYCEKGRLYWKQEIPQYLYVQKEGTPLMLYSTGSSYLCEAAKRGTRLPSGHPEAFIEAFANIYINATDTMRAIDAGIRPTELEKDFPTVDDGVNGLSFVKAAVENGFNDKIKWTKIRDVYKI
ncbi:MAG: Gfo/Idh/MocA family oxidoreductase [Elusimicrobia bacterium]|nr:Gfo/Idh/MocA family oxidoreductase [Elusimicrobiota bacterium]